MTMEITLSQTQYKKGLGDQLLSQAKEFEYLRVLFTSDGEMEHEMDKQHDAALAVRQALFQTIRWNGADLPIHLTSDPQLCSPVLGNKQKGWYYGGAEFRKMTLKDHYYKSPVKMPLSELRGEFQWPNYFTAEKKCAPIKLQKVFVKIDLMLC